MDWLFTLSGVIGGAGIAFSGYIKNYKKEDFDYVQLALAIAIGGTLGFGIDTTSVDRAAFFDNIMTITSFGGAVVAIINVIKGSLPYINKIGEKNDDTKGQ